MHGKFRRCPALVTVIVAVLSPLAIGAAFAATPIAGKSYSGATSGPVAYGFKPPVMFSVSADGKKLLAFRWAGACAPPGPKPPKAPDHQNPWLQPAGPPGHQIFVFVHNVGTINVNPTGKFLVRNVRTKLVFSGNGGTQITASTINGQFKTAKNASGTINYTTKGYSTKGAFEGKCSRKISFSVTPP